MRVQSVILLVCMLVSTFGHADATTDLFTALEANEHNNASSALSRGANPRARNENQETPLHVAARMGHGVIMEALVRAGAEVDARNALGQTPLHVACAYGHEAEVRILLGMGADTQIRDADGLTAEDLAVFQNESDIATLLGTPQALAPLRGPRIALPEPASIFPGRVLVSAAIAFFAIAVVKGNH